VAQAVECLICKCEALTLNPSPTKKREKKKYFFQRKGYLEGKYFCFQEFGGSLSRRNFRPLQRYELSLKHKWMHVLYKSVSPVCLQQQYGTWLLNTEWFGPLACLSSLLPHPDPLSLCSLLSWNFFQFLYAWLPCVFTACATYTIKCKVVGAMHTRMAFLKYPY
jgi:hypothetical protein